MDQMSITLAGALPILLIKAIILVGVTCQMQNNTLKDKSANQPPQRQEVPTFVGSDGIVRKVSPSAILAEMKRCLPSGLPIPVESLWPELPPNLQQKEENLDSLYNKAENQDGANFGMANFQNDHDHQGNLKFSLLRNEPENKRVLRSEDSVLKTNNMASGNQFDVSPRDSVVYAATELDSKRLTDILKELVTKQLQKNGTSEDSQSYIGGIQSRDAVQKPYQTDYPDYDYEDHKPNLRKPNYANREEHQIARNPKRRRPNSRRRQNIPKQNIQDYDYEESPDENGASDQKEVRSWVRNHGGNMFGDALQRQLELSEALQSMTKELGGRSDEVLPHMAAQKPHKITLKSAAPNSNEIVEGYKKVLSMVMELNVNLVQTLEKVLANSLCQKGMTTLTEMLPAHGAMAKMESPDATSVLLDCVDVLMQERKNRRRSKNVFHREAK